MIDISNRPILCTPARGILFRILCFWENRVLEIEHLYGPQDRRSVAADNVRIVFDSCFNDWHYPLTYHLRRNE